MLRNKKRCRVLFSYQPLHEDELELNVDQVIEFLGEVEDGWWKGRAAGRVGVFPSNFVEMCEDDPPDPIKAICSCWTWFLSLTSSSFLGSLLTIGLFLIFLALSAYLRVEIVSSRLESAGETQAIINVWEFPPRLS